MNAESVGDGLLEHCRAYVDWLDDLRRRHPDVMIENCGSGAMRADYAQLSRLDLQSTSDQCDPLIYAAIAAGAGMTILPEQQGNWGYAQQEMDDETAVFTLATGVLGRLYLSGFIDRMTEPRLFARSRRYRLTSLCTCRPAAYGAVSGRPDFPTSTAIGLPSACVMSKRIWVTRMCTANPLGMSRLPSRTISNLSRKISPTTSSCGVAAAHRP